MEFKGVGCKISYDKRSKLGKNKQLMTIEQNNNELASDFLP